MRAIDLFSGCGGLTLGLRQAGFTVLAGVDIEAAAVCVYKANFPDIPVWTQDIRTLGTSEMMDHLHLRVGDLDLLAGCPPCQGFSSVRTRNGSVSINDPRNDLIAEFTRYVRELRPKAVMMENVPGLAEDDRFDQFHAELISLGYQCDYEVLDAADYGVPQRRERLIFIASRFERVRFPDRAPTHITVREAIAELPAAGTSGDTLHDLQEHRKERTMNLIRNIPHNGGSRNDLPRDMQLACHQRCNGFRDIYGRMSWDDVAPTLTSGCVNPSKGRFLHPDLDRAITLREAALLQSFPRDYIFDVQYGKTKIAAMIGNALPPEFIRRHAQQLFEHLQAHQE